MSDIFFMEIFNEILKINNNEIIIMYDIDGKIWFALKDLIKTLGYTSVENAITSIKIHKNNKKSYNKILTPIVLGVSDKFVKPNKIFINEDGLYELLVISNKPLAKIFMKKYITEIMPKIRQTGEYILNSNDKRKLDKINNELEDTKTINKNFNKVF